MTVDELARDLVGEKEAQSTTTYGISGKDLKVTISLDILTPDRFEGILPHIRKNLEEYHRLRRTQQDLEEALRQESYSEIFDVVEKKPV